MTTTQPLPVYALDPAVIGQMLINAVAISAQLRHTSVRSSLDDYIRDDDNLPLEGRFVRDVLVRSTHEIVERWFNGTRNAQGHAGMAAMGDIPRQPVGVERGQLVRIVPEQGPERVMIVSHVERHIITLADPYPGDESPAR